MSTFTVKIELASGDFKFFSNTDSSKAQKQARKYLRKQGTPIGEFQKIKTDDNTLVLVPVKQSLTSAQNKKFAQAEKEHKAEQIKAMREEIAKFEAIEAELNAS